MQQDWGIIFAFGLYFQHCSAQGFPYEKEQDLAGYVLGGRKVGPWVSAMSAEASDMSGWMLMGLPGYAYVAGVSAFWIAIGLAIGTWLNWLFVAKRLRVYTKIANDSITLPDFLKTGSAIKQNPACRFGNFYFYFLSYLYSFRFRCRRTLIQYCFWTALF